MKQILLTVFIVLCVASLADFFMRRQAAPDVPVLYWVTNVSDARERDVELFHRWLEENDYPRFELRLDSSNNNASKKLIQGVSGVGADILTMAREEPWLLSATGMLEDLSKYSEKHGIGVDATYETKRNTLIVDGEQIGFPQSVVIQVYFANLGMLREHGIEELPEYLTHDDFERIGKAFVASANDGDEARRVFFADLVNPLSMIRSYGKSVFNETLTRCELDTSPEAAEAFSLLYKWTYEDRILPSQADLDFMAGSDTVTSRNQLFARGRYALVTGARYTLVQLRKHEGLELGVRLQPFSSYPNGLIGAGSVGMYKLSKRKDLAAYFFEFLASEAYNMSVVESSLGMPPVPKYVKTEEFVRPKDFPNEWNLHEPMARYLEEHGVEMTVSPFVLPSIVSRTIGEMRQSVYADAQTPTEAVAAGAYTINRAIQRTIDNNPSLRGEYEKRLELQERIDQLKSEGQKIPVEWISNSFYLEYYKDMGMLEYGKSES